MPPRTLVRHHDQHHRSMHGGTDSIWNQDDDMMSNSDLDAFSDHSPSQRTLDQRSGSGGGKNNKKKNKKNDRTTSAASRHHAQFISTAKLFVLVIMVVSAICVSVAAYMFTQKEEVGDFEDAFDTVAQNVLETIDLNARSIQNAFQAFTLSVASYATTSTSTTTSTTSAWPFVTVPNWDAQSAQLAFQTGSQQVAFLPKVMGPDRRTWEGYSVQNFNDSQSQLSLLSSLDQQQQQLPADYIWRNASVTDATPVPQAQFPFYYPIWQTHTTTSTTTSTVVMTTDVGVGAVSAGQEQEVAVMPPIYQMTNRDGRDMQFLQQAVDQVLLERVPVQTQVLYTTTTTTTTTTEDGGGTSTATSSTTGTTTELEETVTTTTTPVTALVTPIFQSSSSASASSGTTLLAIPEEEEIVGFMVGWLEWQYEFTQLLPEGVNGIVLVVETEKNCQTPFTFEINGPNVTYLGAGDQHDSDFDNMKVESVFDTWTTVEECGQYIFHIYPSNEFQELYQTIRPWIYSGIALMIFAVAGVVFILYDWTVERNTERIEKRAAKTDAIVNSLFPANVRDRLIRGDDDPSKDGNEVEESFGMKKTSASSSGFGYNHNNSGGGGGGSNSNFGNNLQQDASGVFTTKPIADLFPDATVMFADIVGFTAWSSTREPSQVFTLLETVYNAFDKIANRRKVFKVETIGDCYVAVAGLPEPRRDHAVCMARFSNDCLVRMKEVVQRLETSLGPDTAELSMRFGLHSGPVTAGVLRGEKSRFQLFGDTVNTAARIESTGMRDKIHLSSEAAEHLKAFGKGHWIQQRDTLVQAKGKGEIQTYWLVVGQAGQQQPKVSREERSVTARTERGVSSVVSGDFMTRPIDQIAKKIVDNRMQRLIGWNVDVLKRQLRQILAHRDPSQIPSNLATIIVDDDNATSKHDSSTKVTDSSSHDGSSTNNNGGGGGGDSLEGFQIMGNDEEETGPKSTCVLDEVQDIIQLPSEPTEPKIDPYQIEFAPEVISQLTDFVTSIAQMYHDNPFHNFEHASHVTMSVCKLLSRVVTPQSIEYSNNNMQVVVHQSGGDGGGGGGEDLHKYTYGITSDPICQFACALSALIHDADHPGVPNATLVQENAEMARMYNNKSCAEQNSLDLAWGLLMEPQYAELRECIYRNQEEKTRFRQLLVNSVMATDIADRELGAQRKARWAKAFDISTTPVSSSSDLTAAELLEDSNRKATIVIEHLIQASDVSHTMQHWHVYIKWNEKLFQELYRAYQEGRSDVDPSVNWYKSEIGFFDFYLIPLAKKLKECGVFGVASDEYLSYVQANRKEWELKGETIVVGYLENYRQEYESVAVGGGTIREE